MIFTEEEFTQGYGRTNQDDDEDFEAKEASQEVQEASVPDLEAILVYTTTKPKWKIMLIEELYKIEY